MHRQKCPKAAWGKPQDPDARRAQPPLQSGRPSAMLRAALSAMLRAALSAVVRPPLPTRSYDLAGTPICPLGKPKDGFPKRGLNGAYKGLWAHLPPSPPLPRSGGRGFLSQSLLALLLRSASADCYKYKGAANPKVLAHWWLSPPPLRRGEGRWLALRAPARGR